MRFRVIPAGHIWLLRKNPGHSRKEEARQRYPWVIEWFNSHVDLADLIRQSGVDLRPLSPDSDVLVGRCPCCGRNCLAV